jgi:hypothetical protein
MAPSQTSQAQAIESTVDAALEEAIRDLQKRWPNLTRVELVRIARERLPRLALRSIKFEGDVRLLIG